METKIKNRKKVMRLIDPVTSLFKCKVYGARHFATLRTGGRFNRGAWECQNGCTLPSAGSKTKRNFQ